jgi:hypothetical protein
MNCEMPHNQASKSPATRRALLNLSFQNQTSSPKAKKCQKVSIRLLDFRHKHADY